MSNRFFTVLLASLALLSSTKPSRSAEPYIKKELVSVTSDLQKAHLSKKMFLAIHQLITAAAKKLESEGDPLLAEAISQEWIQVATSTSGEFNVLDLGDHQPLSEWLAKVYSKIEARLTPRICHWLRFDDLKVFNYAIPVTFNPNGLNGDHWDISEYRKHFVPFSGAVTYWTVSSSCQATTSGLVSWLCGTIAEAPRYAMEKWIAPKMSDKVYLKFTSPGTQDTDPNPTFDFDTLLSAAESRVTESE